MGYLVQVPSGEERIVTHYVVVVVFEGFHIVKCCVLDFHDHGFSFTGKSVPPTMCY